MKSEKGTATITIEQLDYYRECEKAIKSGYLFKEVQRWGDVTKYFYSTDKKEVIHEILWAKDNEINRLEAQIKDLREKLEQKRKPRYKIWPI